MRNFNDLFSAPFFMDGNLETKTNTKHLLFIIQNTSIPDKEVRNEFLTLTANPNYISTEDIYRLGDTLLRKRPNVWLSIYPTTNIAA